MRFFRKKTDTDLDAISLSVRDLKGRLDRHEDIVVVDVRQPHAYVEYPGSIPGSVRIPPAELPDRYGELPRDRTMVLYCT